MRILHVISTLSPAAGGPASAVVAMGRAVAELGHDVSIHATDHGMSDADMHSVRKLAAHGLRIVLHRHLRPGDITRHASFGLWRALAEEIPQADVVHLHSLYMFHDWVVWRECRRAGVPYILRPHGTLDPFIHHHHRWRKTVIELAFQNRATRGATLIHYTTESERDLAQPFVFGRPGAVVPLGVELGRFREMPPAAQFRARHPEIGDRRIVLFLGRLNFKKGIEIVVPAVAAAAARHDIQLVFAGPDGGFAARTRELVGQHGTLDRTTFTGHLDPPGVVEAFAAADIFVLPSRTENFGIAAAEAMAAGVPSLISAEVQIAPEAERHGACRVVPLTVADWADAIGDLLAEPEAARAMGKRAADYARAAFDWAHIAKNLVAMYESAR